MPVWDALSTDEMEAFAISVRGRLETAQNGSREPMLADCRHQISSELSAANCPAANLVDTVEAIMVLAVDPPTDNED